MQSVHAVGAGCPLARMAARLAWAAFVLVFATSSLDFPTGAGLSPAAGGVVGFGGVKGHAARRTAAAVARASSLLAAGSPLHSPVPGCWAGCARRALPSSREFGNGVLLFKGIVWPIGSDKMLVSCCGECLFTLTEEYANDKWDNGRMKRITGWNPKFVVGLKGVSLPSEVTVRVRAVDGPAIAMVLPGETRCLLAFGDLPVELSTDDDRSFRFNCGDDGPGEAGEENSVGRICVVRVASLVDILLENG